MQAKKRHTKPSIAERLLAEPYRFQFAQAVRILLCLLQHKGVDYDQAYAHVLRFQNSLSLSFPPSEIESLRTEPNGDIATWLELTSPQRLAGRVVLTPAFIGLLGVNGTLPLHHTERIAMMQWREKDDSARALLDICSNRLVALFCQGWGKNRLEERLQTQGVDRQRPLLLAIGGAGGTAFLGSSKPDGDVAYQDVFAHYAALFRTRPTSAHAIAAVLSEYFQVLVTIEQFVGSWDYPEPHLHSVLGRWGPRLGAGYILGVRLWRHDRRVRLNIGPLEKQDFQRFLPRKKAAVSLAKLLAMFGAPNLEYEVRLRLGPSCIEPLILSTKCPDSMRQLGWDTYLTSGANQAVDAHMSYLLPMKLTARSGT